MTEAEKKKPAAKKPAAAPKAEKATEKKPAAKAASTGGTIRLIQTGSSIGRQSIQHATLIGLGLGKRNRERTLKDSPEVRGMINKVKHLVKVVG